MTGGFDCYGPDESPCTRPEGDQRVDCTTVLDQLVLTARVGTSGGARSDGSHLDHRRPGVSRRG